ncbi:MAG: rod shape-determining protein [Candidatus Eremiobacteraeota bacterium]|nr:rod shape-determining protein [Candidatus Eremiobacteraeota bacterium]MBC5826351.1 rod shape-determining protein [Candidatus Eremiobacteraeota bacterium]
MADFLAALYARAAPQVGIDLGTANTPVFVRGHGIRFVEPTMVAVDIDANEIIAVGEGARQMLGRTPRNISVIRPMRNGVVSHFKYTEALVKQLLNRALRGRPLIPPRVMVGIPGSATEVEKKAVREAARGAGAGRVYFVPQAVAAAVGAKLPIREPRASMIVDIGGGTTEIAIISLSGVVVGRSLKMGGDRLDEVVAAHVRTNRHFHIGERTAEALKISHGYYGKPAGRPPVKVAGQDMRHLRPGTFEVREEDIAAAIAEPLGEIVDSIRSVLEQTPPELARDIAERGLVLAGGGAAIAGFAETLSSTLGIPVRVADEAMLCVALGTGEILRDRKLFNDLFPASQSLIGRWWRSIRFGTRESSSYSSR